MLLNKETKLKFKKIILIGGGELLLYTATTLKKKKINFSVIVSRRHSIEKFKNISFTDYLKEKKINYMFKLYALIYEGHIFLLKNYLFF